MLFLCTSLMPRMTSGSKFFASRSPLVARICRRTGSHYLAGLPAFLHCRGLGLGSATRRSHRNPSHKGSLSHIVRSLRRRGQQSSRLKSANESVRSSLSMPMCARWSSTARRWVPSATCWLPWGPLLRRGQSPPLVRKSLAGLVDLVGPPRAGRRRPGLPARLVGGKNGYAASKDALDDVHRHLDK